MTKTRDLADLGGGFIQAGTGAVQRTVESRLQDVVSVKDFGAVGNGVTDDTTAINLAAATGKSVYLPAGTYLITRPINLTARREGDIAVGKYFNRKFYGDGQGATTILAATNGYPAIDVTGSSGLVVSDLRILADNASAWPSLPGRTGANIGIINRRGTSSTNTAYCHNNFYQNIRIFLRSEIAVNGGAGTIPYFHFGGEHVALQNVVCFGNLPMWVGNIWPTAFNILSSSNIPTYGTEYEIGATTSVSCTVNQFNNTTLVSYDSFRCLTLSQTSHNIFADLYCSNRSLVGGASPTADLINIEAGATGLMLHCMEEGTGLYGATYKTTHHYLNASGVVAESSIDITRVYLDSGIPDPGVLRAAIKLQANCALDRCFVRAVCSQGVLDASGGNPGLASVSVDLSAGSGQRITTSTLIMDNATHNNALLTGTNYSNNTIINNYNRLNLVEANRVRSENVTVTTPQNNSDSLQLINTGTSFISSIFGMSSASAPSTAFNFMQCWSNNYGSERFKIEGNGDTRNANNVFGAISDVKLKENIVDATSQWSDIKALKVRKYNFKEGQKHTQIGLIAQEVELVSPGLIGESIDRDKDGNDLGTTTKSVNYSVLYLKAVKALQEAMERIETLEAKVIALETTDNP